MNQRTLFIADYLREIFTLAELCSRYGISRKTGYKWISRHEIEGVAGLKDRSRRPKNCPHESPDFLVNAIIEIRKKHPFYGPKKLLKLLKGRSPHWSLPAESTIAAILKRNGLITHSRRRRRPGHPGRPDTPMKAPNALWAADFKGQFKTGNGQYCYPLTISDGYSRFLLGCQALVSPCHKDSRAVFRRTFKQYGLPHVIRTDNGTPFASTALGRLSKLSVWWIRLGIYPELIEPGCPQQNGRHERMHKTLKQSTTRPAAATMRGQQRRFNSFVEEYNHVRPHESLGQETPASFYDPSSRPYPKKIPQIEYPAHYEVRYVSRNGGIRWHSNWVNVSHVLAEQYVGLEEVDNDIWDVYFGTLKLGRLHEKDLRIEDALGRKARKKCYPSA
jgi:putative transposase